MPSGTSNTQRALREILTLSGTCAPEELGKSGIRGYLPAILESSAGAHKMDTEALHSPFLPEGTRRWNLRDL
jgi:hypothetical protein